jgi:hypothetical protein
VANDETLDHLDAVVARFVLSPLVTCQNLRFPRKLPVKGLQEVICLCGFGLVALKVVWDGRLSHDLSPWDETLYLARGVRLFVPGFPNDARGLPPAEWGPVYSLFYAFLHLFVRDLVSLFFANWTALVLLCSAAFYGLVRALRGSAPVALLATALLASSRFFDITPYPGQFATLLLLVGAVLVARAREEHTRFRWALVALLLATFVRPELFVAFVLATLVALWRAIRGLTTGVLSRGRLVREAVLVGAMAVGLFGVFGNPMSRDRSFMAFGQHYALNIVQRDNLDADPWANWEKYFSRDFGNARSLTAALRANPGAILRHVEFNLEHAPLRFAQVIEPKTGLEHVAPRRLTATVRDSFAILVAIGFVLALRGAWRNPRTRAVVLLLAAMAVAIVASAVLMHPRWHYLLPLGAFLEAFAAVGIPGGVKWLTRRVRRRDGGVTVVGGHAVPAVVCLAVILTLVPNAAHGWCLQSVVFGPPPRPTRDLLKTVETLRGLRLREHVVVLEKEWGCAMYAGLDFERIDEWIKNEPFGAFVARYRIGVIVVTSWLAKDDHYGEDAEYRAFLANPASLGFRVASVPETDRWIAVRNDAR